MVVKRSCPICSITLDIKDSDIDRVIKCPWCESPLVVQRKKVVVSKTGLPISGEIPEEDPWHFV